MCSSRTRTAIRSTPTTRSRSTPSSGHGPRRGRGCRSAFQTIEPPELLLFSPTSQRLCNFTPTTFVDITSVIEQKRAAMAEMKAQAYLHTYYDQRAEQRGNRAPLVGRAEIRYAEAFQRVTPQVVDAL